MPVLLFMRHGEPDYRSYTRELTKEGVRQARCVAEQVIQAGISPDIIISSDLPRAKHTAQVLAEELLLSGVEATTKMDERIKEIEARPKENPTKEGIRGVLSQLDDKYQTVAIVGHKDELAQAVFLLTGKSLSFHYANAALVECHENTWAKNAASSLNTYKQSFEPKSGSR